MKFHVLHQILLLLLFTMACSPDETTASQEDKVSKYDEQHRPQLHFSPPANWMNDPNGMVYFEGEYHLFYQYYPESTVWGPMHWGHAISTDLVHWNHLPIALYPDEKGYIFSGSAVVDWFNTSGFSTTGEPPLVAIFTYHDMEMEQSDSTATQYQSQAIAYSNDKGRTWTKYEGNPVIPNPGIKDFRDPKVIRDTENDQWVMVFAAGDHVQFYGSKDLKKWYYLSSFGQKRGSHAGVWECPDFFPLEVPENGTQKWVLLSSINPGGPNGGSATQYFVGEFDGKQFRLDQEFASHLGRSPEAACWFDFGRDNYAGVTWSDIEESDGRRIFMGWMSNWDYARQVPTELWRSAMTLPRVLELHTTAQGPRLYQSFPKELQQLREDLFSPGVTGVGDTRQTLEASPQQLEVIFKAACNEGAKSSFGFMLSNKAGEIYRIGYNAEKGVYFSDRSQAGKIGFSEKFASQIHQAPKQLEGALVTMHIIFDVASAELIADDGLTAITDIFFPNENFTQIDFFIEGQGIEIQQLDFYTLERIWQ
jgi:fructan beta-fructosidase